MISSTVISAGGSTNMEKNPEAVATAMEFEEKEAMWARILAKMEELSSALDRVLGSPSASSTRISAAASSPLPATTEGTCSESDATPMPMAPTKSSTLGIQFPAAVVVESTSVIAASVPATPLLLADQVVVHDAIQVENNLAAIMPTKCSTIGLSVNADQQLSEFIREATPCASPTAVVLDGDLKHDADPFSNEDYHGVLTHVGGMSLFLELGFNSTADKFGEQPFKDMTWDVELADTHDNGVSLFRDLVLASTQPCCRSVFISGFKEKLQMMKNDGELCEQWDPGILLEKTFRLAGAVFPNDNGDAQIEYLMHILSAVILWIEPPNVIAESIRSGGSETVKSVLDNQNEEETWGSDALDILLETWNVILGEADADRSPMSADGALAASSLFKIIVESQLKAAADSAFEDGVDAKYFHVSVSKHDEQLTLYALIARTASDTTIPFLEQLFSVQFARLSQTDVGHDPTRTLEELYWLLLITSHVLTDAGERETLLIPEALHGGFPNVVDSSLVDGSIAKSQELFECFNWQHPIVVAVHDVDRTKRLFVGSKFQILEAIGGERPAPWPSWRYYWCGELLEFQSNDNIHDHWQNTKVLLVLPEHLLPLQQPQRRDLLAVCKLQDVWIPIMHIMPCIEVWDGHVQWDPGELLSTMNGEQEPKHTERSWRMQSIGARGYRLIIGMNDSPTPWDPGIVAIYESAVPVRVEARRTPSKSGSCKLLQPVHAIAWGQAMFCRGGSVTPDIFLDRTWVMGC